MNAWSKIGSDASIRKWRWVFLTIGLMSAIDLLGRVVGIFHGDEAGRVVSWHSILHVLLGLGASVGGPWLWWMTRVDKGTSDEPTEV
jgi:hypothetical protein